MVLSIQREQLVATGSASSGTHRAVPLPRTGGSIDVAGLEDTLCVSALRNLDHGPAETFGGSDALGKEPPQQREERIHCRV
jgi:hypothetical protein